MAVARTDAAPPPRGRAAARDAGFAGCWRSGCFAAILALRTEQNMSNELVLQPRLACCWLRCDRRCRAALLSLPRGVAVRGAATVAAPARLPGRMASRFLRRSASPSWCSTRCWRWRSPAGGAVKWIDNFGIQILIYVMLGWGLNIVVGLAGLLDLGYVAFYAVGAYSYALLATNFGLSFWVCLPLAGILAAFWGVLLGFPVLRLRGDYLAIVTLAFGEIIRLVLINWVPVTNGYAGITGIPRPPSSACRSTPATRAFAAVLGIEFSPTHRIVFLFYLILALALLTNWVTIRLRRLPIGRAWEALREDEIACRALGINTTNTKLTAFAIGAMFGGFAGAFFATRQGFISPESFTFMESALVLAIVVLGGMGSQIGVAIAAVAMIGGTEILRELDWLKDVFGPDFDPTQYRMLLFGLAMVLMMIWKPRGLISFREPSIFLAQRKLVPVVKAGARLMASAAARAPVLRGRAPDHALWRAGGGRRPVVLGCRGRDHRHHRPQRRRQDHGLQLHHRFLQADRGRWRCGSGGASLPTSMR